MVRLLQFLFKDCGIKNIDCQIGNGAAYTGEVHKTKSGIECQAWNVVTPHNHGFGRLGDHNQCRNPDGEPGAWCYTTDKNKRWDLCDVRQCVDCDKGKKQSYPDWFTPPLRFSCIEKVKRFPLNMLLIKNLRI